MPDYTYLIIGGGMTADAATAGIRGADPAGSIGLIGAEPHPPYNRPPLSKALWKGESEDTIWRTGAKTAALRLQGRDVVMLIPEAGVGARVFPADLSRFLVEYYGEKGVTMRVGEGMAGLERRAGKCVVRTTTGQELTAEVVVAGLGIQPSVELAEQAGLRVGNGIEVDEFCRSSHPDIYAAGGVASFHNPALDARIRVEHEDNANTMGKISGQNMAGQSVRYTHLPFFYSDLFELGYEAVGDVDSRLETVADWKTPFREGVVYYLKDRRVRGVLLWNTWGQVDHARALIAEPGPFTSQALKGRLPA